MKTFWRRLATGVARGAALCSGGIAAQPAAASTGVEFEPVGASIEARPVAKHSQYVLGQAGLISTANEGFKSNAGFVITPEGVVAFDVLGTLALGRRLAELIATQTDRQAAEQELDFQAAYARVDWTRFAHLPAFSAANRPNAYQTFLNLEQVALRAAKISRQPG